MTFIHGYLLFGLLLAGIPVLLHLLMRQKPRRMPFPAFRFLKLKQVTNRRKLRLQHLLILLLRILVVVALCLALARPRVFSERLSVEGERPVAAILLFDTSPSMEYSVGGVTRLDEARQRARELLVEMNPASRVAILDAGDDTGDSFLSHAEALSRLDALAIRPGGGPVSRSLDRAYRLAEQVRLEEDAPPCFFYIFSDRTRSCWDPALATRPGTRTPPKDLPVSFVDVGVESPRDLAIRKIEVDPPVVAPGALVEVRVTVTSTGGEHDNDLVLSIDNDTEARRQPQRRTFKMAAGQMSEVITFGPFSAPRPEGEASADVPFQVTVKLATSDNLPFNNTRHATFLVRAGRRLLTITDRELPRLPPSPWVAAIAAVRSFRGDLRTREQAERLTPNELSAYRVVALYQVPHPGETLLNQLTAYVRGGGGLAIIPPGDEMTQADREAFNQQAKNLLPAPLNKLVSAPKDGFVSWDPFRGEHPLTAPFQRWAQNADPDFAQPGRRPFVRRYWQLGPLAPGALAIATYADATHSPALAELAVPTGRVILFTTPLDTRPLDPKQPTIGWHNYLDSSFVLPLVDRVCRHLAGDIDAPELNYLCGQLPQAVLPAPLRPPYTVQGPELAAAEANLAVQAGAVGGTSVVQGVPQAVQPGNYLVSDGGGRKVAGFSLDVRPEESDLERVPAAEIESVLGSGSVLQVGRSIRLADAMRGSRPPPVELLPLLMMALLLILTLESLLASWFYRPPAGAPGPEPDGRPGKAVLREEKVPS
jgi:hypothetical protein